MEKKRPLGMYDPDYLRLLSDQNQGNLTVIARRLGVTRQGLTRRMRRLTTVVADETISLLCYSELIRVANSVKGPRMGHRVGTPSALKERDAIAAAWASTGGYREAAAKLGVSPSTVIRRIKKYKISIREIKKLRKVPLGG